MRILFVCTGNTCRSPMAEAFMNLYVKNINCDAVSAFSRGMAAYGDAVSENSVIAAREYGADISSHVSEQLTLDDIADSDIVLTMTKSQSDFLKAEAKKYSNKIFSISEYAEIDDIPDPYGQNIEIYKKCAKSLWNSCEKIFKKLVDE